MKNTVQEWIKQSAEDLKYGDGIIGAHVITLSGL